MSSAKIRGFALALTLAGAGATMSASAQTIPSVPTFPNEQRPQANYYMNDALALADGDMLPAFLRRCILTQQYTMYGNSAEDGYQMPPIKVYDNLYWVGQGAVSSWAVKTTAGLVMIDALNNANEAANIVVPGLRALGLDPNDIKYVIITHEHADHYGGVRYLQDTYGAQGVSSNLAWNAMDNGTATRPRRDITVSDGQDWTVGDTTFTFVATPGHTPGTLTTILPVSDHGTPHMGAIYGSFGVPGSATDKMTQIDSLAKFGLVAQAKGVDVLLANHQTQDLSLFNHDLLRHRRAAVANPASEADFLDPHPYTVGTEPFQRHLMVQSQCGRLAAARANQTLPH